MVIDFDLSTVLVAIILLSPVLVYARRVKMYSSVKTALLGVFLAYLVGVASQTLFPIYLDSNMRAFMGQNVWSHIHTVPLVGLTRSDALMSLLNVILFIPFGFLLPFLTKRRGFSMALLQGFLFSVGIETMQFVMALLVGFTFRYVDINDVIFNSLGAMIGYAVFLGVSRVIKNPSMR